MLSDLVRRQIRHPATKALMKNVYVKEVGWFTWNASYRLYCFSPDGVRGALIDADCRAIDFTKGT